MFGGTTFISVQLNSAGQVTSMGAPGQTTLSYVYDTSGNLTGVTNQAGTTTTYSYPTPANHLLGTVTTMGVNTLVAAYDPNTNALTSLTGPRQLAGMSWSTRFSGRHEYLCFAYGLPEPTNSRHSRNNSPAR